MGTLTVKTNNISDKSKFGELKNGKALGNVFEFNNSVYLQCCINSTNEYRYLKLTDYGNTNADDLYKLFDLENEGVTNDAPVILLEADLSLTKQINTNSYIIKQAYDIVKEYLMQLQRNFTNGLDKDGNQVHPNKYADPRWFKYIKEELRNRLDSGNLSNIVLEIHEINIIESTVEKEGSCSFIVHVSLDSEFASESFNCILPLIEDPIFIEYKNSIEKITNYINNSFTATNNKGSNIDILINELKGQINSFTNISIIIQDGNYENGDPKFYLREATESDKGLLEFIITIKSNGNTYKQDIFVSKTISKIR